MYEMIILGRGCEMLPSARMPSFDGFILKLVASLTRAAAKGEEEDLSSLLIEINLSSMKIDVYNQQGEKIGTTLLPKEMFELQINSDLVHWVAVSQMANQRIVTAHTKDRGEVRGGGRKPWRQKGTGRARHGSRRSPLWRGGGVTFGPTKNRIFKKKINKKIKRKTLLMVLSGKVKRNLLIVLDKLRLEEAKTKSLAKLIENWKLKIENFKKGSVLIALPKAEENIVLAAKNLPEVKVIEARNLNVLNLLSFKYLIMPKEAIKIIKETFVK